MPGVVWPAIAGPDDATFLALQYQLQQTQWLSASRLRELQFRQLTALLPHAYETVPYYRWQWHGAYESGIALTPEGFERLPLLRRTDLQQNPDALKSSAPPPAHGAVVESRTPGSTGIPVFTLKTALTGLWWRALTLRDHLWHRRDFSGKLAAIRRGVENGEFEGWGPSTDVLATGRSATLALPADPDTQLEWLVRYDPDYLLTYPSNAAELARISFARELRYPRLREVRTFGELLSEDTRELCRRAWNVRVTDLYSCDEAGYVALQCPEREHYHVQSESVLVEVLDEQGKACAPGAVGRIVITTLQNFAMPLIRYDIGDLAELGAPCPCGRGLPVIRRFAGRVG